MLANSVLGRLYGFWLCSAIFNLLRAIYRPFARAFHNSSIVNFLRRSPKIELYYAASVTGRVINAVWYWLVHVFSLAMKALYVPARHSAIVRAASGSHFCNFEFIMCASFLCMFVAPHSMWSNSYALLLALGLFGLYFLMAAAGSREAVSPLALGFPFLLFVLAVPVSFIFTTDMGDSVRVAMFFVAAFLFTYVFMADLSSTERLERLMRWIYFAVLLTAVYACYQRVVGVEVSASYTDLSLNAGVPGRVYSTLDNPNNYAEFLVLFTPLSVAWAMQRKKPTARFFACCGIALPLLALVMTYCRSGWLSIAVSALVFVYYLDKRLIPPAIVVCILAIPFLPDSIMTRLLSIFNSSDSSANFRILVWQGVLDMLGDYGLTGIGMGPYTFANVFPLYAVNEHTTAVVHTQMLYLELFVEWGILGFIGFMWLILRHVKNAGFAIVRTGDRKVRYALMATCSSFCGIAVLAVFEYIWYYPRILFAFFILLGISLACIRMSGGSNGAKGAIYADKNHPGRETP